MATPRNVCHRCRHKWKVKRGEWSRECPKCGHANVGPTDPAPSLLPKLGLVILILAGGAYYLGLIGDDAVKGAQEAAEKAAEQLQAEVEKRTGSGEPAPAAPGPKPPAPGQEASGRRPSARPSREPEPPASAAPRPAGPRVEVASKMGWAVGSAYRVKGKIENRGGAPARGVRVHVVFHDAQDQVLARYEAECAVTSLEPGESAPFESAVAGAEAERVDDFEVEVELAD